MYKSIILLLSFISLCCAANQYGRAELTQINQSGITASAAFIYYDYELNYQVNVTSNLPTASENMFYIILNHGDLTKTPSFNDIYNPESALSLCNKPGFVGYSTSGAAANLAIDESGSVIGLAFVVVQGISGCEPDLKSLKDVNADPILLAWGIIGVGNVASSATPSQGVFSHLNLTDSNSANNPTTSNKYTATCVLAKTAKAQTDVNGTIYFETNSDASSVTITAQINNLVQDSIHGIHIHTFGDLSFGQTSIGGHWNNGSGQAHALPNNPNRDFGDLGNVCVYNQNIAYYKYSTSYFPLASENNIIGRAIAIHANRDNGSSSSFGDRIAWCVIGVSIDNVPFTVPASLVFADPPVCGPSTPTPTATTPTSSDSDSSSSVVQTSILFIISLIFVLLI